MLTFIDNSSRMLHFEQPYIQPANMTTSMFP